MKLFHYTSVEHLAAILQAGYIKTVDSNVSPSGHAAPDVVWLTTSEQATQDWQRGSAVDKGAVRIAVDVPDAQQWPTWARTYGITERWYNALNLTGGGDADRWYVVPRRVELKEVEEIRLTRLGPLAVVLKAAVEALRDYATSDQDFRKGFMNGAREAATKAGRAVVVSAPIIKALDQAMASPAYQAIVAHNASGRGKLKFGEPSTLATDDPLVSRYLHALRVGRDSGLGYSNTHAWEALAEKRMVSIQVASLGKTPLRVFAANGPYAGMDVSPYTELTASDLAFDIVNADTYLWLRQIEEIATTTPLPRHIVEATCAPLEHMFWSRQGSSIESNGGDFFYLRRTHNGLVIFTNVADETFGWNLAAVVIPFGMVYPDGFIEDDSFFRGATRILQMLAFMNSRYTGTTKQTAQEMPREIRREYARRKLAVPTDEISVVTLRRSVPKSSERVGKEVSWQHQWWVSAHWRNQAMGPGRVERQLRWIPAYIKGPEDKPILERVYAVTR